MSGQRATVCRAEYGSAIRLPLVSVGWGLAPQACTCSGHQKGHAPARRATPAGFDGVGNGNCNAIRAVLRQPGRQPAALRLKEATMRTAPTRALIAALILGLSGGAYAQGAGAGGGTGGGNGTGKGGAGMGTPNAGGTTDSISGASGTSTMEKTPGATHEQKKRQMDAPASGEEMKKAY
jgi:hypothetical protein